MPCCCATLDHGDSLVFDVLLATFIATPRSLRRQAVGNPVPGARVSGKTVEGLLSGFLAGTAAFWFAGLYQDWLSGLDAALIGACVAAAAPLGDLFESMIKRDLEVKDSGGFFGEHGECWTASTPPCSRSSSATTSPTRCSSPGRRSTGLGPRAALCLEHALERLHDLPRRTGCLPPAPARARPLPGRAPGR